MQVILREDVPTLGMIGEVVRVKPGYARNFLFPRGLAVPADKRNLKELEHHKRLIEIKKQRERGTYERLAQSIGALSLEIEQRAGRGGRLFGSVTNIDIHRLLEEKGVEIDRRRIELKDPIKEIGEFQITIKVGQDITTEVPLSVKPLGGELEAEDVDGAPVVEDVAPAVVEADAAADNGDDGDAAAADAAAEGESAAEDAASAEDDGADTGGSAGEDESEESRG